MNSRSNRRLQSQVPLNNIESLLLAQAVWELGAGPSSWATISKILSKHPLLTRPKSFFSPQSCHSMYENLMKEAELEVNEAPHASENLKLAQKYYRSRFIELQGLILAEESKFKTVLKEIEDIRTGLSGNDSRAKNRGEKQISSQVSSDELFNGSDLGRVTESSGSSLSSKDNVTNNSTITTTPAPSKVLEVEITSETETTPKGQLTHAPQASLGSEHLEQISNNKKADSEQTNDKGRNDAMEFAAQTREKQATDTRDTEKQNDTRELHRENEKDATAEMKKIIVDTHGQEEELSEHEEKFNIFEKEAGLVPDEEAPDSEQHIALESDSETTHTSAPEKDESAVSEEEQAAEGHRSEIEEPVIETRRSSRRRKSSVQAILVQNTRTRLRPKARPSESESHAVSESEVDAEVEGTPAIERDAPSPSLDEVITRRGDGKRKASFVEHHETPDKKRTREDSEPADDDEPGPGSHNPRSRLTRQNMKTEEQVALKKFQNVIGMLHSQISQHRNGNIFHNPIKNSEAPDYHEIVKRPMDLKTIKSRVKDGVIANSQEFQRDIYLMFANAMMYNRPGSDVHAMAEDMMLESEGQINAFRQTEGLLKRRP